MSSKTNAARSRMVSGVAGLNILESLKALLQDMYKRQRRQDAAKKGTLSDCGRCRRNLGPSEQR
jgi:hypothetical protein